MKHLSILLLVLGLCVLSTPSRAQSAAPVPAGAKQIPVRNLAVCFIYAPNVPELYYRDAKNEYARLKIDAGRFGSWNVIPDKATLELYKKTVTPEVSAVDSATGKKTIVTPEIITHDLVQTWTLTPGKESMQRLYYYSSDGTVKHIDWNVSPASHGLLQARVMNLLDQSLALRLGAQTHMIAAGQQSVLTPATGAKEAYTFQYGFEITNAPPFVSSLKTLGFRRPQQRITIIISYMPVFGAGTAGGMDRILRYSPQDVRFYEDTDRIPPPLPPVIVYPKTALR